MAVAPRKAKKSPAQVEAGQAFAAGGRAAQAAKRARAVKKTGKPPPRTAAQKAAGQRFAAAGRTAQALARAKKGGRPVPPRARAAVAPEPLLARPEWPVGCNDLYPTCASAAVACHLRAATGLVIPDGEILRLHKLAGGPSGATISDVLEAARGSWLKVGANGARVRLQSFFQADETFLLAGMIVGVTLGHEGHAVLAVPGGMISWGQFMPWKGEPEEAWALEWVWLREPLAPEPGPAGVRVPQRGREQPGLPLLVGHRR